MLSTLLLIKIAVTLVAVLGLAWVAEHVSPRLAGILAGFPLGLAIILFFVTLEQGPEFGREAAFAAIGGLSANAVLALAYAAVARGTGWIAAIWAGAIATVAFLGVAAVMRGLMPGVLLSVAITCAVLALVWWALRQMADVRIARQARLGPLEVAIRAGMAAATVLLITGIAGLVGPVWSGLLAGFPVVAFPLLLILHARHGRAPVVTMVKSYPIGLTTLVIYALVVAAAFPVLGAGGGTLVGLAAAVPWLAGLSALRGRQA
ncbi:hypothetical protein [Marimonas lutisalis]|uniref:hypothetical protein n=1 Tax=Marimonas lutisalis TaxID=2545756 RepID=UPI0010F9A397|nr:hypothetical protein [Marimonas lutisalis]